MSAHYELFETPTPRANEQKPSLHARIIPSTTIRIDRICKEISSFSSFSPGDIKGMLEMLSDQIVRHLERGENIELEGIGHFSATVTCQKPATNKRITSSDIRFKTVRFRCCKSIKKRLRSMEFEPLPQDQRYGGYPADERKEKILKYLRKKEVISSSYCMGINRCSRYMALKDLSELIAEGKIVKLGYSKFVVYGLKKE